MNWDDAGSLFTWDEMKSFQWGELKLNNYELLSKSQYGTIALPKDIQEKLSFLCPELCKRFPDRKSIFQSITLDRVDKVITIALKAAQFHKYSADSDLPKLLAECFNVVENYLRNLF